MNQDHYRDFAQEWAQRMRDGKNVTHEYLSKPVLFELVGDTKGKSVLCIGCGSGEECKVLKDSGASRVVGIDLSDSLVRIARDSYPDIEFHTMDMEKMDLLDQKFDIVVSNLVMHYVPSWTPTLKQIEQIVNPGAKIIISTNHPVRFGAEAKRLDDREIFILGYIRYKQAGVIGDVIGDYLTERKISDTWFRGRFHVEYYHRPISSLINEIVESKFEIEKMLEPLPPSWVEKKDNPFFHIHTKIPLFVFFVLRS